MGTIVRYSLSIVAILATIAVGVLIGIYGRAYTSPTWVDYSAADSMFGASFPVNPREEILPAPPPFTGEFRTFTSVLDRGAYQVAYADIGPKAMLAEEAMMAHTASHFGGRVAINEGPSTFQIVLEDKTVIFCKIVRAGSRVYRLSVSHAPWYQESKDIEYFFARFQAR